MTIYISVVKDNDDALIIGTYYTYEKALEIIKNYIIDHINYNNYKFRLDNLAPETTFEIIQSILEEDEEESH